MTREDMLEVVRLGGSFRAYVIEGREVEYVVQNEIVARV